MRAFYPSLVTKQSERVLSKPSMTLTLKAKLLVLMVKS